MLNWFKGKNKKKTSDYSTNEDWIEGLSQPVDDQAVAQLRQRLVRGLKPALRKYVDHELNAFVEDVVQDAVLKIILKRCGECTRGV